MTRDVHLELMRDAFETAGVCGSKCGAAGDRPEQQPQASWAGVTPQRKDNAYSLRAEGVSREALGPI